MQLIDKTLVFLRNSIQGDSLRARSKRGVVILGVGTIVERVLRLARNMILTRLLMPNEFGLMAIVLSMATIFEAITDVGIKQSVVHNKSGARDEYLNVAWWFQAIRGIVLFVIAFSAAPLISSFYRNPDLLALLRVSFFSIVLNGLISPGVHVLEKTMRFGKLVFLYQGSGLVGVAISLGIAFLVAPNVWALVMGFLGEAVCRCLLSFIICPFRPRLRLHRESLSDVMKYARNMLGVPILAVIALRMDVLVLGRVVSDEQVGLYWLGQQLALQMNMLFRKVVPPVLLPAFAEKQDDKALLCRSIIKVSKYIAVLAIPITTFLIAYAKVILPAIYGSEYAGAAIPCALMCVFALISTQGSPLTQTYFATGQPQLHRRFVALRLAILACLIYPAARLHGSVGVAVVVVLANLIGLCMQVIWMRKPIGLRLVEYATCWLPGLRLAVVIMVPAALFSLFEDEISVLNVSCGVLACVVAYIIGLVALRRPGSSHVVNSRTMSVRENHEPSVDE